MATKCLTRWLTRLDLPEVARIELATGGDTLGVDHLGKMLRDNNIIPIGAFLKDELLGFLLGMRDEKRMWILSIAVRPERRRQRIGEALLNSLKWSVRATCECSRIVMEVSERNVVGQLFLRSQRLHMTRTIPGWCLDTGDDGYRFAWRNETNL